MRRPFSYKSCCALLLIGMLCAVLPVAAVQAKQPGREQGAHPKQERNQVQKTLTAAQAAARAQAKHGGKVLKVTPVGKGFKVKLLSDSGRVRTVTVKD